MEPPFVIRFFFSVVLLPCLKEREKKKKKKIVAATCNFSLIIVKSLQLCGCRQIAEPHKYCLVRVIVILWHVFSLFFFFVFFCFSQVRNSV